MKDTYMADKKGWITDEIGFMLGKNTEAPKSTEIDSVLDKYAKTVLKVSGGFANKAEAKQALYDLLMEKVEPCVFTTQLGGRIDRAIPISAINQLFGRTE